MNILQVCVGTWNSVDRLNLAREEKGEGNMGDVHPMANKTFVITTIIVIFFSNSKMKQNIITIR